MSHIFEKPVTKILPYMLWNLTVYGFIRRTEMSRIFEKPVTKNITIYAVEFDGIWVY
jgi:hypothetical protein